MATFQNKEDKGTYKLPLLGRLNSFWKRSETQREGVSDRDMQGTHYTGDKQIIQETSMHVHSNKRHRAAFWIPERTHNKIYLIMSNMPAKELNIFRDNAPVRNIA